MNGLAKVVENFGTVAYQRSCGVSWGVIAQGLGVAEGEVISATMKHNAEYMNFMRIINDGLLEETKSQFMIRAKELMNKPDIDDGLKMKLMHRVERYLNSQCMYLSKQMINMRMMGEKTKPSTKPVGGSVGGGGIGGGMRPLEEAMAEYEALSKEREQVAKEYEEVMARMKQKK